MADWRKKLDQLTGKTVSVETANDLHDLSFDAITEIERLQQRDHEHESAHDNQPAPGSLIQIVRDDAERAYERSIAAGYTDYDGRVFRSGYLKGLADARAATVEWRLIGQRDFSFDDDRQFLVVNSNGYMGVATCVSRDGEAWNETAEDRALVCSGVTAWRPAPPTGGLSHA